MPWARLMRGSRSKLNTVAPLAASARSVSSDWATPKKLRMDTPSGSRTTSSGAGALTCTTSPAPVTVAAASGAMLAPASL